MADLETLKLKIIDGSDTSVQPLENLASALTKVKTATSGSVNGLNKHATGISAIASAVNKLDASSLMRLKSLSDGIQKLQTMSNVKLSATLPKNITSLSASLGSIPSDVSAKISTLANALTPLTQLGKSNLAPFVTQLSKLPTVLNQIDMQKLYNQISSLTRILKPFAAEMATITAGFDRFPTRIQNLVRSTERYNSAIRTSTTTNNLFNNSFATMIAKLYIVQRVFNAIGSLVNKSNEYQESLNLFTASMGEYADAAFEYGQKVSEIMGIDIADWIYNQGIFMTLGTGLGVVAEDAALMSKNLTQLGYDISSFFNLSVDDSMKKLQSALSGELEPVRNIGYALSQNTLQELYDKETVEQYNKAVEQLNNSLSDTGLQEAALSVGMNKSLSEMTEAEKVYIRYIALMKQNTVVQGDMARTLESPANQLRILQAQLEMTGRAIGNIFIPALNKILPYAIAVVKAIREIANALADLFDFELTTVDYSGIGAVVGDVSDSVGGIGDSASGANDAIKEMQKTLLGIDEINKLSDNSDSGSGSGGSGGGSGFDFELPEYDFLGEAVSGRVDEIMDKLRPQIDWLKENLNEIIETVAEIGVAIALWKAAPSLISFVDKITTLSGLSGASLLTLTLKSVGLSLFVEDVIGLIDALQELINGEGDFDTATEILARFSGAIGDVALFTGNYKVAGILFVIEGISDVVGAISDIVNYGVDFDTVLDLIDGIAEVGVGVGLITKNWTVVGIGLMLQGIVGIIDQLDEVWTAITTGDWSEVDKVNLLISAVEVIAGLVIAFKVFDTIKNTTSTLSTASKTIGTLDTTISTGISPNLTSLMKNLAVGIVIIAELAVISALFVASIWIIGELLQKVYEAWNPVIENGGTTAIALGVGTLLLVAIGTASALLGTLGTPLIVNIALGTAILALLGIATILFVAEIWIIGELLQEVGEAWKPVLEDAETIAIAIGVGTGLLVVVGVATAALGAATVASAGTLPVAIGLGTAMLVLLAEATKIFIDELVSVAKKLSEELHPELDALNKELPDLTDDLTDFTDFMGDFASQAVKFTKNSAISGISATINTIIGFFTNDPIESMANDVQKTYEQSKKLNDKLNLANPELEKAIDLFTNYSNGLSDLEELMGQDFALEQAVLVNMPDVGENIVIGLINGISSKTSDYKAKATELANSFAGAITNSKTSVTSAMTSLLNALLRKIDSFINSCRTALNNLLYNFSSSMRSVSVSSSGSVSYRSMPYLYTTKLYAEGGFPSVGEMFIANEAGPEMIGRMGSSSAVANNDQIAEGFASAIGPAMYNAVLSAMKNANGQNGPSIEFTFKVDSEDLWKMAQKGKKKSDGRYYVETQLA